MLVPWWIMAAWAYELGARPLISDALFDDIARELTVSWDRINHPHKGLLSRVDLKTSLAIGGKWPRRSISAAKQLLRDGVPRSESRAHLSMPNFIAEMLDGCET